MTEVVADGGGGAAGNVESCPAAVDSPDEVPTGRVWSTNTNRAMRPRSASLLLGVEMGVGEVEVAMAGATEVGFFFLSMPLEAVPAAGVTSGDDGGLSICSRRGMTVALVGWFWVLVSS